MSSLNVLTVSCTGCGACCATVGIPPFTPGEAENLLPDELDQFRAQRMRLVRREPCLWYVDGRCSNYDRRPLACRLFTPGGRTCSGIKSGEIGLVGGYFWETLPWLIDGEDDVAALQEEIISEFGQWEAHRFLGLLFVDKEKRDKIDDGLQEQYDGTVEHDLRTMDTLQD